MNLRSGRIIFNNSQEESKFLNTYCSISNIKNKTIFKQELKKLIKNWYLWLAKKHIESEYILTPWLLFGLSISNAWKRMNSSHI